MEHNKSSRWIKSEYCSTLELNMSVYESCPIIGKLDAGGVCAFDLNDEKDTCIVTEQRDEHNKVNLSKFDLFDLGSELIALSRSMKA